jgi:hypothetical protein
MWYMRVASSRPSRPSDPAGATPPSRRRLQRIHAVATSAAPRTVLFDVVAETERYTEWSAFDEAVLERPGTTHRQGVGARRRLRLGRRSPSREEVVAFDPGRTFSYALLEGPLPVRDYVAVVTVDDEPGGGSRLTWSSTFRGSLPGTGWTVRLALGRFIRQLTQAAVAEAERRGGAADGNGAGRRTGA